MAFTIEESFHVAASPDRVWAYLVDPSRVVECLPGAELLDAEGEGTFRGRMTVSVGPVRVVYEGTAEFTEVDQEGRRVEIEASGQEVGGTGSARMTMESAVVGAPEGGAQVRVRAEVDVAGKIVQFGRGMIRTVSSELFRQFSDCTHTTLEAGPQGREAVSTTDLPPGVEPPPSSETRPLRPLRLLLSALVEKVRALLRR